MKNVTSLPSYPPTLRASKRAAFTLAEVLITLAIVGIVAAITLPPLITNIQSQVKAKRVQNIKQKFSKATDKMLAMNGMNGYGSTENFVEELKHHLKIAKVCDNDHLSECWGYQKVKLKNGDELEINSVKKGQNLRMFDDENNEWASTVGIVTADGTSMILSYNKKCDITLNESPQWSSDQSTSANCVAAVFDYNGGKNPNMFDHSDTKHTQKSDITLLNAGGLGENCKIELDGKCFTKIFKPSSADAKKYGYTWCAGRAPETLEYEGRVSEAGPITNAGETASKYGIRQCFFVYDYWNAAVVACGGRDKMISLPELAKIAERIYGVPIQLNARRQEELTADSTIAVAMGFPDPALGEFFVWGNVEYNERGARFRGFADSSTQYYATDRWVGGRYALCAE